MPNDTLFLETGPMTNEGNSRGLLVIEAWSLVISCRLGDFAVLLTASGPNDEFSKSKGQKVPRKPAKGLLVLARHSWLLRLSLYQIRSPSREATDAQITLPCQEIGTVDVVVEIA